MGIAALVKVDKKARRVREILAVLARYGLADWLKGIRLEWLQKQLQSFDQQQIQDLPRSKRLRLVLTELGTAFIKLGQMLSTRADLIGPDVAEELKQLQSQTPADPPEIVRQLVEAELGQAPAQTFQTFEEKPLGSASIGQVHRATLPSGEQVVVKVQHKGIADVVAQDIEILAGLAELAENNVAQLRQFRPVATTAEFSKTLLKELDFTRERRNLEQFAANFRNDKTVHFPRVFSEFCTKRVLTMEMLRGVPLTDRDQLVASGHDLAECARRGAQMYVEMVFRDGFYHADPHPGNLLLLEGNVIGVLDCGMAGRIDDRLREDFEGMLLAVISGDSEDLTDSIVRLATMPPRFDRDTLRAEVSEFIADYGGQTISNFDLSGALNGMTDIMRRYSLVLPPACTMLLKVLVMLEGTAKQLDPNFSLAELLEPYQQKALQRRLSPKRMIHRTQRAVRAWDHLMEMLPRDAAELLERMRRGRFDVNLQHRRLDTVVNRLVSGILTAALFMGSALLWYGRVPPLVEDTSFFGALGCFASAIWSIWILRDIRKSAKVEAKDVDG